MLIYFVFVLLIVSTHIKKGVCFKERSRRRPYNSNIAFMRVPEDLSFEDKISFTKVGNIDSDYFLTPNTDIHQINGAFFNFDVPTIKFKFKNISSKINRCGFNFMKCFLLYKTGAENLGTLLWAVVSFYGT